MKTTITNPRLTSSDSWPPSPDECQIQTDRLNLRPPRKEDVEGLWPFVTNLELTRFLAWEPHVDKQQTACLVCSLQDAQSVGRGFHWVVLVDSQIAGMVSLIDIQRAHRCWTIDRAELAYWVGPPFQNRGIATEASRAIVEFAFRKLRLHRVVVYHAQKNEASGAIPAKLGFRRVGVHYDAFCKNDIWHSLVQFEKLAETREVSDAR